MIVTSFVALCGVVLLGKGTYEYFGDESEENSWIERVRAVPIVPTDQVKDGDRVRVVGRARAPVPLVAPGSERSCAFYELTFREDSFESKRRGVSVSSSASSDEVRTEKQGTELLLEDDTGVATLWACGIETLVTRDHTTEVRSRADKPALQGVLRAHGISIPDGSTLSDWITFDEGVIEQGERVAVVGRARWEPSVHPIAAGKSTGYRHGSTILRLYGTHEEPMLLTDDPRALV